jgi:C-terminal processing protease CtpA/Prc
MKHQNNVTIVGEETGGGSYGNTAWMIPDVVLPQTKIRFRLPLFRLVMDQAALAAGRGITPDIVVIPTAETIRKGIDPKAEKVKQLILERNKTKQP